MENKNFKILFLTFWTPPTVRPRAITIGKLMPELIKQGLKPVIITYENNGQWNVNAPIYKIPVLKSVKGIWSNFLFRNLNEYLYYRNLFKQAKKIIKKYDIQAVFSFSNPQASNILGAMIKKKLGIKFVSHFSDPWYDNPYKSFSKIGAKKVLFLEKFIIKNSDRVIFTNKQALELVMKKYPSSWNKKSSVIPHPYDSKKYPRDDREDKNEFIISHIGAFYKERNPEMLFQALSLLKKAPVSLKFKIRLIGGINQYAGYSEQGLKSLVKTYNLEEDTEVFPSVDYQESLRQMMISDCLVVIDANFSPSPFLPSKVIDYAGAGKIIIGITPKGSPTDYFLSNLGFKTFSYGKTKELTNYLDNLINKREKVVINGGFLEKYKIENITRDLINIFKKVLK